MPFEFGDLGRSVVRQMMQEEAARKANVRANREWERRFGARTQAEIDAENRARARQKEDEAAELRRKAEADEAERVRRERTARIENAPALLYTDKATPEHGVVRGLVERSVDEPDAVVESDEVRRLRAARRAVATRKLAKVLAQIPQAKKAGANAKFLAGLNRLALNLQRELDAEQPVGEVPPRRLREELNDYERFVASMREGDVDFGPDADRVLEQGKTQAATAASYALAEERRANAEKARRPDNGANPADDPAFKSALLTRQNILRPTKLKGDGGERTRPLDEQLQDIRELAQDAYNNGSLSLAYTLATGAMAPDDPEKIKAWYKAFRQGGGVSAEPSSVDDVVEESPDDGVLQFLVPDEPEERAARDAEVAGAVQRVELRSGTLSATEKALVAKMLRDGWSDAEILSRVAAQRDAVRWNR